MTNTTKDLDNQPLSSNRQHEVEALQYAVDRDLTRLAALRIIPLDLVAAIRLLLGDAMRHTHPYQFEP